MESGQQVIHGLFNGLLERGNVGKVLINPSNFIMLKIGQDERLWDDQ